MVKWCAARNICCMAGVYTPSEMWAAHKAGAHIVKLFPGAANGAAFVKVWGLEPLAVQFFFVIFKMILRDALN